MNYKIFDKKNLRVLCCEQECIVDLSEDSEYTVVVAVVAVGPTNKPHSTFVAVVVSTVVVVA